MVQKLCYEGVVEVYFFDETLQIIECDVAGPVLIESCEQFAKCRLTTMSHDHKELIVISLYVDENSSISQYTCMSWLLTFLS